MLVLAVALAWLSLSGLVSLVALRRGLPPVEFFAVSILISPVLALPFAVIFRDPEKMIRAGKARRCPYCRHVVKVKIEICPHCGLEIPEVPQPALVSDEESAKAPPSARSKAAEPDRAKLRANEQKDSEVRNTATHRMAVAGVELKIVKRRAAESQAQSAATSPHRMERRYGRPLSPHIAVSPWKKPSTISALALVAILMLAGVGLLVRASRHRAAAAAPDMFQAELAVSTPTWVALYSDDQKIFVGALEPGKSMVFSAKQKLQISAESPDNLAVKINGKPTPFAGHQFSTLVVRKGEPITQSH